MKPLEWILYSSACEIFLPKNKIFNLILVVYGITIILTRMAEIIEKLIYLNVYTVLIDLRHVVLALSMIQMIIMYVFTSMQSKESNQMLEYGNN